MEYGSLTAAQRRIYHQTVAGSHSRRFTVLLLNLNGKVVRDLTDAYQGGSLQGDVSRSPQDPVELFEAQVLDVENQLDWSNGEHRHYQLRVIDHRYIPALDAWVEEVGFEGPVWDAPRQGPDVRIIAHGGERHAMGSVRNTFTRPRKAKAHAVMHDLLAAAGAKKSQRSIPKMKARIPRSVTIGVRRGKDDKDTRRDERRLVRIYRADPSQTYFGTAAAIAKGVGRDLFWEPGRFVVAALQTKPSLALGDTTILAPVEEKGPEGEVINTWNVLGKKPKGKKRISAVVQLPRAHNASPQKMGWNDTRRNVTERVEGKYPRKKQARAEGMRRRKAAMRELVTYQVQAVPVRARFRPRSLITVPTTSGRARVRVMQWTIPYSTGSDAMTIGVNRKRG